MATHLVQICCVKQITIARPENLKIGEAESEKRPNEWHETVQRSRAALFAFAPDECSACSDSLSATDKVEARYSGFTPSTDWKCTGYSTHRWVRSRTKGPLLDRRSPLTEMKDCQRTVRAAGGDAHCNSTDAVQKEADSERMTPHQAVEMKTGNSPSMGSNIQR